MPFPKLQVNPEIQKTLVKHLKAGNFLETAMAAAGISRQNMTRWLTMGAKERNRAQIDKRKRVRKKYQIYVDLLDAIEQAQAESEIRDVKIMEKAAKGNWQAAAWRLERKYPERWGKKSTISHQGRVSIDVREDQHRIDRFLAQSDEGTADAILVAAEEVANPGGKRAKQLESGALAGLATYIREQTE